MAGKYLTQWTALKTKFEEDAGKKIAAIEKKKPVKQKVSGLREKDGVARLKKPAEKILGFRKESGMETACKALDSATAAKVDAKTRTKALSTYTTAEEKYIEVLLNAARVEPYSLVTKEIIKLRQGMEQIAADFTKTYTQPPRVQQDFAIAFKKLDSLIKELEASAAYLGTVSMKKADGVLTGRSKVIAAHLKKLNSDTVSQIQPVFKALAYGGNGGAPELNTAIVKLLKRIVIEQTVAGSEVGKAEIKNKKVDVDTALNNVRKEIKSAISKAKECHGFAEIASW